MQSTYKATLRGDRIEWEEEVPERIRGQDPLSVFITILDSPSVADEARGRCMAEALERIAGTGGVPSIPDAARWQREQRRDREIRART